MSHIWLIGFDRKIVKIYCAYTDLRKQACLQGVAGCSFPHDFECSNTKTSLQQSHYVLQNFPGVFFSDLARSIMAFCCLSWLQLFKSGSSLAYTADNLHLVQLKFPYAVNLYQSKRGIKTLSSSKAREADNVLKLCARIDTPVSWISGTCSSSKIVENS